MQHKRISLDGAWQLYYIENERYEANPRDVSTITNVQAAGFDHVPAIVPGNFELDFQRAGIIDDPFVGTNFIDNYKYECLHFFYCRTFTLDFEPDKNTFLRFEGIDTISDIYVNGVHIGETNNQLIPFEFQTKALHKGENEIVVHITPTHIASRKYQIPMAFAGHYVGCDTIFIRKAPHSDGWDILSRILSAGIWRPCYIEQRCEDRVDDVYIWVNRADVQNQTAELAMVFNTTVAHDELADYSLTIEGVCGDSKFSITPAHLWHTGMRLTVGVKNAKFWWPRGYGDPNLYDVTATLSYKGEVKHVYKTRIGIRYVTLDRTSTTDKDGSGEFCFHVNGKKIFWKGTNWVPVDALHSRDAERLPKILPMLLDSNSNCVRCWGGNVYENDIFYDFCDENGIMIWQDFTHACHINPQDDEYCGRFYIEVETIVKRLRQHASIMLWAGDNEVDANCYTGGSTSYLRRDPNTNRLTREVIPKVLLSHDFTRPYLPSSPYVDEEAFASKKPISEAHLWGPRHYHFKSDFFANAPCHFASETGYHGCPSPASLRRFIRPEQLWHWRSAPDSSLPKPDWGAHSSATVTDGTDGCVSRIQLTSTQVNNLFPVFRGREVEMGLENFARASQISQAEAKKFFVERFRVAKWRRTGIIWWNLIDGWPEISDSVVDYYGTKKLAYHYIKRSQQPLCFIFREPEEGVYYHRLNLPLHVVSDLQEDVTVHYTVRDLTAGTLVKEDTVTARDNTSAPVFTHVIPFDEKHFYFIEWDYEQNGEVVRGCNHYMTNITDIDYDEYLGYMKQVGFYDEFEGFEE